MGKRRPPPAIFRPPNMNLSVLIIKWNFIKAFINFSMEIILSINTVEDAYNGGINSSANIRTIHCWCIQAEDRLLNASIHHCMFYICIQSLTQSNSLIHWILIHRGHKLVLTLQIVTQLLPLWNSSQRKGKMEEWKERRVGNNSWTEFCDWPGTLYLHESVEKSRF